MLMARRALRLITAPFRPSSQVAAISPLGAGTTVLVERKTRMMRKLGLTALLFVFGSVAALAADFNGKWNAQVQGRNGMQTLLFDFHVDGSTLTGTITTPRGATDISNGKVDGDTLTFDQVLNFNGNSFTISYTGKAAADGTIQFTRQFGAAGDRPPQDFTAKRGDAAPAAPQP
jgi:hypothetical protein